MTDAQVIALIAVKIWKSGAYTMEGCVEMAKKLLEEAKK